MEQAKHTPGPWERLPELDDETGEPTGRLDDVIYGPFYTQHFAGEDHQVRDTVCAVGFSAHNRHEANASLICAAPDMKHALDVIATALEMLGDYGNLVKVARAALAKAGVPA